jgi:hypothetical protein
MKTAKTEETVLIKVKIPKRLKAKAAELAKAEMRTLNAVFVLALKARVENEPLSRSKA